MNKLKTLFKRTVSVFVAAGIMSSTCGIAFAQVQDGGTYISIEDAACVAESLVNSLAGTVCIWTDDTTIEDIVELYDENREPTAYSFELSTNGVGTGYVIISARYDVPNMILEFADDVEPLYKELDAGEEDLILYTGALNYYKETFEGQFEALSGEIVSSAEIINSFETLYNPLFLSENQDEVELASTWGLISSENAENGIATADYIEDPYDYADENYTGPFVLYEWKNPYEQYEEALSDNAFSTYSYFATYGYSQHCGPTAIINLMQIIGNAYGQYNLVMNSAAERLARFREIAGIQNYQGENYYRNGSGVYFHEFDEYLIDAFSLYGSNITSTNVSGVTYENVKAQIDAGHPFAIGVRENSIYGNHFVAAYAYCRLISETTGFYKSFVKIADGHNGSGRYLDIATVEDSEYNYLYTVIPG